MTNFETVTQRLIILLTYLDLKEKLYQSMNLGQHLQSNVILRKKNYVNYIKFIHHDNLVVRIKITLGYGAMTT